MADHPKVARMDPKFAVFLFDDTFHVLHFKVPVIVQFFLGQPPEGVCDQLASEPLHCRQNRPLRRHDAVADVADLVEHVPVRVRQAQNDQRDDALGVALRVEDDHALAGFDLVPQLVYARAGSRRGESNGCQSDFDLHLLGQGVNQVALVSEGNLEVGGVRRVRWLSVDNPPMKAFAVLASDFADDDVLLHHFAHALRLKKQQLAGAQGL
mmetsp:Transcript_20411/g.44497  ORF Transcript_20411/g.44497 Transcript_20411/m.44497 type:complete len:210 (-) Transcript_20411:1340-1969(-)